MWWIFELLFFVLVIPFVMIGGVIGTILSLFDMRLFLPAVATGLIGLNLIPFSQPRENAEFVSVLEVVAQIKMLSFSLPIVLLVAATTLILLSTFLKLKKS